MSQEKIEKAKQDHQIKMDKIISAGAGCIVMDEDGELVTEMLIASLEIFLAIPFFDRNTGEIMRFDFWVFFQEFYFDQGMQYSHLIRMNKVDWIHEDYVVMVSSEGWSYHISKFESKEVDPRPHELRESWQRYFQDMGLEETAAELRAEYFEMMEAQL